MNGKIVQNKGRFFASAAATLVCISVLTSFLSEKDDLPLYLVAAGNITLLIMTAVLIWSAVVIFREKILFQGGENGLYINFPPVNRGTVPWKNIDRIECGQGNTLTIYLSGLWDGEGQFDIKSENGKRCIVMKLGKGKNHIAVQKLSEMKESACPEPEQFKAFYGEKVKSNRDLSAARTAVGIILSKFYFLSLLIFLFAAGAIQNAGYFNGIILAAAALLWVAASVFLKKRLKKLLKRLETASEEDAKRVKGT